jgi:hypothetical protein
MFIVLEERNAFLWGTTRSLGRGKNLAIYTERISLKRNKLVLGDEIGQFQTAKLAGFARIYT